MVASHYARPSLVSDIEGALARHGVSSRFDPDDIATMDAFHLRGRGGTVALAELAELGPNLDVLDLGSGIGGTARYLAANFAADVTGIDLTPTYCQLATDLSYRCGLSQSTRFLQGSALDLPFADGSFDVVWTEHVQMNVSEKAAFYAEATRVLRPGGQLAFHDVFAGPGGELVLPVPWAATHSISHLARPGAVQRILRELGLELCEWVDTTAETIDWLERALDRSRRQGPHPLGLQHLIGPETALRLGNVLENLYDARIVVTQSVWEKRS